MSQVINKKHFRSVIAFIITISTVLGAVYIIYTNNRNVVLVTNYQECVARGYSIMEKFPPVCRTPDGQTFTKIIDNSLEKIDLIRLEYPDITQTITSSPIMIRGVARGNWFFEASFPVEIIDMNGNILHIGIATAESENWMTPDFVPFTASLELENDFQGPALLTLRKHNPSDYRELDDSLIVPINIDIIRDRIAVNVYFSKASQIEMTGSCESVSPIIRYIPKTQETAKAAILELLEGPTFLDKANGFFTSINFGVTLNSISIVNGEAFVDFSEQLEIGIAGSCRVTAIRSQITETLNQFPSVNKVIISINGRIEDVLQP